MPRTARSTTCAAQARRTWVCARRPSTLTFPCFPTALLTYLKTSAMSTRLHYETHRAVRPKSDALIGTDRTRPLSCPYARAHAA
eukprot:1003465-Pleurochrysis_carterae.AAC.4